MGLVSKELLRILQVDDDDEFTLFTEIFLKSAGFKQPVTRFSFGAMAVDYLSRIEPQHAPHVILLDLNMPGMSVLEMLDWLRKKYRKPEIPVYVLTSSDDPEDRRKAANAGATKYFLKTGLFDELIQELDQLIAASNHKHLEEIRKMPETMAELALIAEFVGEMVILTDAEGRIEWVNEPFVQTFGYNRMTLALHLA